MNPDKDVFQDAGVAFDKLDDMRVIVHLDMDCFYAQVEMLKNPSLRERPLGIQQKNLVVTTNYVARACGVKKTMSVADATLKFPELVLINGEDLSPYRKCSADVTSLLQQFTPQVEKLGLDENFIDVTDLVEDWLSTDSNGQVVGHIWGDPQEIDSNDHACSRLLVGSHIALEMRLKLKEELGLTSSAGIGHNKLLAKLVSSAHKPNQQTVIFPEQVRQLMLSLGSVRNIPGIGASAEKMLETVGVATVEDLQKCPTEKLTSLMGRETADKLKKMAFGEDNSTVKLSGKPLTLGIETSFRKVMTEAEVDKHLFQLLDRLAKLVHDDGRCPGCMKVTVRKSGSAWSVVGKESRQCAISGNAFLNYDGDNLPEESKKQLMSVAKTLFTKMVDVSHPFHIVQLGVGVCKLSAKEKGTRDISLYFRKQDVSKDLKRSRNDVLRSRGESSKSNASSVPNDIDIQVFSQLPADIQMELQQEWASLNRDDGSPVKKSKQSGNAGILKYFMKK